MIRQKDSHKRGAGARNKGKNAELELARILREFGIDARRGHCFEGEPDVVGMDGIHIEVKRQETLKPYDWMTQAVEESANKDGGKPSVFFRKDHHKWLVCVQLEDFVELWKEARKENV